jgi:hypothetical protein
MSPLVQLTLAVSLAPSAVDYERLARRCAFCWGVAINGDVLSAARNACTPLALDACATEADARRAFTSTLTHLRDVREQGFARLLDTQIAFLAGVAVQLFLSHREEQGARPTLPAPPAAEGEHHDYGCRCPECDELDDEHVEGPDYAYEREHCAARLG